MKEIDHDTVIRRAENAISREINGEVVLLTPEDSKVHVLDEVGSRVWELCSEGASIKAIVDEITSEYEVTREAAQRDIIDFVDKLMEIGVVQAA